MIKKLLAKLVGFEFPGVPQEIIDSVPKEKLDSMRVVGVDDVPEPRSPDNSEDIKKEGEDDGWVEVPLDNVEDSK